MVLNLNEVLLVFAKNPILGKVKTRIAATVGVEKALTIYRQLLEHSAEVARAVSCKVMIFHGGEIDTRYYAEKHYEHFIQQGNDIGLRMAHAIQLALQKADYAVLVGTDVPELQPAIIEKAFRLLHKHDVVFGPAQDGGYYLIGMKAAHTVVFEQIKWSTSQVLEQSIAQCQANNLSYDFVDTLRDIDYIEDWQNYLLKKT